VKSSDDESEAVRAAVRAVRSGNTDAFSEIVKRYQRRVFGLTLMVLRDPGSAEEVTQDAFVRAYTHLAAYDTRRPFYPWLATIAVRLAQNRVLQRIRIRDREVEATEPDAAEASVADPLSTLMTDEEGRRLWQHVSHLPAGERTAVILHYRQDLGIKEVARALGVTAGTVKTFLFRARQKLRRLAGDRPGGPTGGETA
jgi:RNA polymerase sigma-70 factor (ECF subfamily)